MSCCGGADIAERISDGLTAEAEQERRFQELLAASHFTGTEKGVVQTDFLVPAMHCAGCIAKLEKGIGKLSFVHQARANLSTKRVSMLWVADAVHAAQLERAFTDLGFEARPFDLGDMDKADPMARELITSLGVAGFAAANIMLLSVSVWSGASAETAHLFHLISGLIAVPAVFYAGRPFFRSAWSALSVRRLNMDVPISLAILLALGMSVYEALSGGSESYFDACTSLLFFLLIGRTLDHHMRARARGAISRLQHMAAKGADRIGADGAIRFVPLKELRVDDTILIPVGARVPVDCTVSQGTSDLDWSLVNGESEPVCVQEGSALYAGVLNLTGPLQARVTKSADTSFLAQMLDLMSHAEQGKARYRRIADRLAEIYAPAVHLVALVTFIGWLIASGDWQQSLYIAITTLIITCPCALGLAVPIVHVVASGRLFEAGVLVKDGAALEKLTEVDHIVFDKTGTLTLGQPMITRAPQLDSEERRLARALAQQSTHPASKALVAYLQDDDHPLPALTHVKELPGQGMEAQYKGATLRLGSSDFVAEIADEPAEDVPAQGSLLSFGRSGEPMRQFIYEDTLRPHAAQAIAALGRDGYGLEILSGDRRQVVADLAGRLNLHHYFGHQTPQDKIARIEILQERGHKVLYVGDGLNDAPALAAAHTSMAPASASDVGQLAADLVFTSKGLDIIGEALNVAKRTDRLVKQNFGIALCYNAIAIPLAMAGYVSPLVAAIAMSSSSIVVVANSLRLNIGRPRRADPTQTDHTALQNPQMASL